MFNHILKLLSNAAIRQKLVSMENELSQMRSEMELFKSEVMDNQMALMDRLSKRIQTRYKREMNVEDPQLAEKHTATYTSESYNGLRVVGGKSPEAQRRS